MMEKQLRIWRLILESLNNQIGIILLYVLESSGSSPGRKGFFMAVNASGDMQGSVGGGMMEYKFVEMAKDKLLRDEQESSVRKQMHDKEAAKNQSGMICSGEQTIFLHRVQLKEKSYIESIIGCLVLNKNGLLQFSPEGLFFSTQVPVSDYSYSFTDEQEWLYQEKLGYKNRLYIIGAGHCSLAFSWIMREMDFYITLYDDRQDLKTFLENEYVHEKFLLNDYGECKDLIPPGNHYIVVMTVGYRTDDIVIRSLMNRQFMYFGVLGSKKKLEKMFTDYRKEGIGEYVLTRIYSPVGISINSKTPEEIAVSIAAEIISVKNA
ncbi:MAG: XdhC family protein [Bacteroidota bacterium]